MIVPQSFGLSYFGPQHCRIFFSWGKLVTSCLVILYNDTGRVLRLLTKFQLFSYFWIPNRLFWYIEFQPNTSLFRGLRSSLESFSKLWSSEVFNIKRLTNLTLTGSLSEHRCFKDAFHFRRWQDSQISSSLMKTWKRTILYCIKSIKSSELLCISSDSWYCWW